MAVTASHNDDGVTIVKVTGSLIDSEESSELRRVIEEMVVTQRTKLLIDLSQVTYANSTTIGVLMSAHTSYMRRGWALGFCGVRKELNVIFAITKLNLVFNLYRSREEALKSLSARQV